MNQNTLSSAERRSYAVLDAYGSRPAAWPADERQQILDCIAHSAALQRYQTQLGELDADIASAQAAALPTADEVHALKQRILASLPAQTNPSGGTISVPGGMRIVNWLSTSRYALSLVAVMVLAVVLSLHRAPSIMTANSPAASSFAAWSWYDITGQVLPVRPSRSATLTMTDLIDLEISQDGG